MGTCTHRIRRRLLLSIIRPGAVKRKIRRGSSCGAHVHKKKRSGQNGTIAVGESC